MNLSRDFELHVGGGMEEELQLAAKLGKELLSENERLKDKNEQLWALCEERTREIDMLRTQNKMLREDANLKAHDQVWFCVFYLMLVWCRFSV